MSSRVHRRLRCWNLLADASLSSTNETMTGKGDPVRGVLTKDRATPDEGSATPELWANSAVMCSSYSPASAAKYDLCDGVQLARG
jgi:hypothetical protein